MITFGGEGAANIDLDDLWVFNVETKKWTELETTIVGVEENGNPLTSISGRKFHSTVMLGNRFFVIAGCKMNYTCVPSIYSIDLEKLFNDKNNGIS